MLIIKIGNVSELSDSDIAFWKQNSEAGRVVSVLRKRLGTDRKRSILGDISATFLIRSQFGYENSVLCHDPHGRPYVKDCPFFISISHSENKAICVLSDKPVGIDIEKVRKVGLKTKEKICSGKELAYIGDDDERFFEVWTAKEAYSKFTGEGVAAILRGVYTDQSEKTVEGIPFKVFKTDGYVYSLVSENNFEEVII